MPIDEYGYLSMNDDFYFPNDEQTNNEQILNRKKRETRFSLTVDDIPNSFIYSVKRASGNYGNNQINTMGTLVNVDL